MQRHRDVARMLNAAAHAWTVRAQPDARRTPETEELLVGYAREMAVAAIQALEKIEKSPDALFGSRRLAIPCAVEGCAGVAWDDAKLVAERQRHNVAQPHRYCPACWDAGKAAPARSTTPESEPWSADHVEQAIARCLAQIVELDGHLLGQDWGTPRLLARAQLGDFDRAVVRWQIQQDWLINLAGNVAEADRWLEAARRTAGTWDLFRPPENVADRLSAQLTADDTAGRGVGDLTSDSRRDPGRDLQTVPKNDPVDARRPQRDPDSRPTPRSRPAPEEDWLF